MALACLAGLTYTLRENLMAFFGTLSGVIMRERVVSYVIGPLIIEERWNQKVPSLIKTAEIVNERTAPKK